MAPMQSAPVPEALVQVAQPLRPCWGSWRQERQWAVVADAAVAILQATAVASVACCPQQALLPQAGQVALAVGGQSCAEEMTPQRWPWAPQPVGLQMCPARSSCLSGWLARYTCRAARGSRLTKGSSQQKGVFPLDSPFCPMTKWSSKFWVLDSLRFTRTRVTRGKKKKR